MEPVRHTQSAIQFLTELANASAYWRRVAFSAAIRCSSASNAPAASCAG